MPCSALNVLQQQLRLSRRATPSEMHSRANDHGHFKLPEKRCRRRSASTEGRNLDVSDHELARHEIVRLSKHG